MRKPYHIIREDNGCFVEALSESELALIHAAPELLEALKSAKRVLESGNLESQDAEETAIEILEAIAKAKGKESHV